MSQPWRDRLSKALPRNLSAEAREKLLDWILADLNYASRTEIVVGPYREKHGEARKIARRFRQALEEISGRLVKVGVNVHGENERSPWVDLHKIAHDANEHLELWWKLNPLRAHRPKETAVWLRERVHFAWRYYTKRQRGCNKLLKAIDEAEHLRVGMHETPLPKLLKPKRRKAPRESG